MYCAPRTSRNGVEYEDIYYDEKAPYCPYLYSPIPGICSISSLERGTLMHIS